MIYIVFLLAGVLMAFIAFLGGFMLAIYLYPKQGVKPLQGRTEANNGIVELTEQQKRELKIRQLEMENFFKFEGDPLPKPEDKVT